MTSDRLAELAAAVDELVEKQGEDHVLLQELQQAVIATSRPLRGPKVYDDWMTWVADWLTVRVSRSPHRVRWCHHYAEHPEVADRLEALWHAWELAWPDPVQRLTWFRDGLDHQLAIITADHGPFRDCSAYENQHVVSPALNLGLLKSSTEPLGGGSIDR